MIIYIYIYIYILGLWVGPRPCRDPGRAGTVGTRAGTRAGWDPGRDPGRGGPGPGHMRVRCREWKV